MSLFFSLWEYTNIHEVLCSYGTKSDEGVVTNVDKCGNLVYAILIVNINSLRRIFIMVSREVQNRSKHY